jgi:hypothetical protein
MQGARSDHDLLRDRTGIEVALRSCLGKFLSAFSLVNEYRAVSRQLAIDEVGHYLPKAFALH